MAKQILLIFAHPDDESFTLGGTIAKYTDQGVNITLVVATKGEAGQTAGFCQKEELGLFREQELMYAAKVLGITEVIFLGYPDKEVSIAPPLEIVGSLVSIIRTRHPQVVITFGADGSSGHQDHRAIHHFTKAAVRLAKEPAAPEWGKPYALPRLCYVQSGWRLTKEERLGMDYTVSIAPWAERKWEAILEHRTQGGSRQKFESLEKTTKEDFLMREYFKCDDDLSAFPGRGEDITSELERVKS